MSLAFIVKSMADLGCSAEQIAAAVIADEAWKEARRAKLREGNAERQRRRRAKLRHAATEHDPSPKVFPEVFPEEYISNPFPTPFLTLTEGESAPEPAATRLPADFEASDEDLAFGKAEWLSDEEISRSVQDLRLWAAEATGPKALRADWHATARRFMRRDADAKWARIGGSIVVSLTKAQEGLPKSVHVRRDSPQGQVWWAHWKARTGRGHHQWTRMAALGRSTARYIELGPPGNMA